MGNDIAVVDRPGTGADVEATADLLKVSGENVSVRMAFVDGDGATEPLRAIVVWPTPAPLLTDICSLFDHFGLRVAKNVLLDTYSTSSVTVSLFEFARPGIWRPSSAEKVASAFSARGARRFVVDEFSRLIVAADIGWREVTLIRSASRFLRQAGLGMSPSYVLATLTQNPEFASALVALFTARFEPALIDRQRAVSTAHTRLATLVEDATSVDEDRILRSFASFVSAVLRTNWFDIDDAGEPKRLCAFLIDSPTIEPRGTIVPFREIFVDSDDVEGIHARSGSVARGGIRYSDRPEDYRTEVLGLMKTQAVKNSPVVPNGAKGAFVRKNSDVTPEHAYRMFISGLLDVTDNLVNGHPTTPDGTVSYADDNSYLVVAADKGTAQFSDTANELAVERGFWLGDAFASGGSTGYDHKAMGITARGAWVSVRNHFDELGIDLDTAVIRVIGIGDMSGDVFGNGMLMSRNLKLVAAFDHRHIFIDPDPDPAKSFDERQRLAGQNGSSWDDYNRAILSNGGGVWSRTSKTIVLPPAARAVLGLSPATLTPNQLIRAILSTGADLLWNGGIGTYVKSIHESHSDASDPANDAIRINAQDLKATVVGEGGNLGLTQQARIDFALAGGRINADFIDNAAGVATSDREVNMKIALESLRGNNRITDANRLRLFARSEEEVAADVLTGCANQVLAISVAEGQAAELLSRHERLIDYLDRVRGISRASENLPTRQGLATRTHDGGGLTRPEIAVLMAHSKNIVRDELLESGVPDDPVFERTLNSYFPARFRHVAPEGIRSHRLAREIVATAIADDMINHVGPGLPYELDERLGVSTASVAAAYTVVRELFDTDALWRAAGGTPETRSRNWVRLREVRHLIEHTSARLLQHNGSTFDIALTIERYLPEVRALSSLAGGDPQRSHRLQLESFDLCQSSTLVGTDIARVATVFLAIEEKLGLDWITQKLTKRAASHRWDALGAAAVHDQLIDVHHRLTVAVLRLDEDPARALETWQARAELNFARFMHVRAGLTRDNLVDVARAVTVHAELTLLCRATER